jgi:hypothetical protein
VIGRPPPPFPLTRFYPGIESPLLHPLRITKHDRPKINRAGTKPAVRNYPIGAWGLHCQLLKACPEIESL